MRDYICAAGHEGDGYQVFQSMKFRLGKNYDHVRPGSSSLMHIVVHTWAVKVAEGTGALKACTRAGAGSPGRDP